MSDQKPLAEKLREKIESKAEKPLLAHPCQFKCSGWSAGHVKGELCENTRLIPYHEAMIEAVAALEKYEHLSMPSHNDNGIATRDLRPFAREALDGIRKILEGV